jgi:hypothetical protein
MEKAYAGDVVNMRPECQITVEDDPKITNFVDWLDVDITDRDRMYFKLLETPRRTQPDEFSLRWIQPQTIAGHPPTNLLNAAGYHDFQKDTVLDKRMTIDLQVICISMSSKTMSLHDSNGICGIHYEEFWTEDRTLWNSCDDVTCSRHSTIETCVLSTSSEV